MTFPTLSVKKVLDFTQFRPGPEGLTAIIARLETITAPEHDTSKHEFNDPEGRGVCTTCS